MNFIMICIKLDYILSLTLAMYLNIILQLELMLFCNSYFGRKKICCL